MSTISSLVEDSLSDATQAAANISDTVQIAEHKLAAAVFEIVGAAVATTIFSNVAELRQHLAQPPSPTSSRLYTLEGLPLDYLQAFGAHFKLIPDFINSHARREPYRKERWHQARDTVSTGTFKYPELVDWIESGCCDVWGRKSPLDPRIKARKNATTIVKDAIALQLTWPIAARFDRIFKSGALLSHASFWSERKECGISESLLMLEDSIWRDARTTVLKPSTGLGPLEQGLAALAETQREWEAQSCGLSAKESSFTNIVSHYILNLRTTDNLGDAEHMTSLLRELSIAKWEAFHAVFESFVHESIRVHGDSRALPRHTRHLRHACFKAQSYLKDSVVVSTASTRSTMSQEQELEKTRTDSSLKQICESLEQCRTILVDACIGLDEYSNPYPVSHTINDKRETTDLEAKRSTDRLAYLAGFLLPFSVFASILAMTGEFAAGEGKFYVYWVVTVPLSIIVLAVIYADSIRRMTGWEYLGKPEPVDDPNVKYYVAPPPDPRSRQLGWLRAFATIFGYRPRGSRHQGLGPRARLPERVLG